MHFIRGLKSNVRIQVEIRDPDNLNLAIQTAERIDTASFKDRDHRGFRGNRNNQHSGYRSQYSLRNGHSSATPMELGNMQHRGRNGRFRRLTNEERETLRKKGGCFYCRQPGHMASECPQRPKPKPKPRFNNMEVEDCSEGSDHDSASEN